MKFHLTAAAVCAVVLGGCATQGDLNSALSRIYAIETRLAKCEAQSSATREQLEQYLSSRGAQDEQLREQSAQLYATLEQLKAENQVLNGRIEEMGHSFQTGSQTGQAMERGMAEQLSALEAGVQQNSDRIQRMEQFLNLEVPKSASPPPVAAPPETKSTAAQQQSATSTTEGEETLYARAMQAFEQNDYPGARSGFEAFLAAYPDSSNADNAQFWIGETYYREKWYEKAILEYQKVIEKYPKGNKVAAALLKQGYSFFNIGDQANARLILKELIAKYPKSSEAEQAEKKLKGF
jgi:tol-pal system protein YbgF